MDGAFARLLDEKLAKVEFEPHIPRGRPRQVRADVATVATAARHPGRSAVAPPQLGRQPVGASRHVLPLRVRPRWHAARLASDGSALTAYRPILGGDSNKTAITVDGGNVRNHIEGNTAMNFSQEVVEEFQLSSANFDLSTGITSVGSVNIVTRTGATICAGRATTYSGTTPWQPTPR